MASPLGMPKTLLLHDYSLNKRLEQSQAGLVQLYLKAHLEDAI